jgi:hypothetical protein
MEETYNATFEVLENEIEFSFTAQDEQDYFRDGDRVDFWTETEITGNYELAEDFEKILITIWDEDTEEEKEVLLSTLYSYKEIEWMMEEAAENYDF